MLRMTTATTTEACTPGGWAVFAVSDSGPDVIMLT
jgi:hypothetical protein